MAIQDDRFSASRRLLRENELASPAGTEHLVDFAMRAIGSTRPSG